MQPSHAAKNERDLIKKSRVKNNANLLFIIIIINKAILGAITDKIIYKNDSKEQYKLLQRNYRRL